MAASDPLVLLYFKSSRTTKNVVPHGPSMSRFGGEPLILDFLQGKLLLGFHGKARYTDCAALLQCDPIPHGKDTCTKGTRGSLQMLKT